MITTVSHYIELITNKLFLFSRVIEIVAEWFNHYFLVILTIMWIN